MGKKTEIRGSLHLKEMLAALFGGPESKRKVESDRQPNYKFYFCLKSLSKICLW